MTTQTVEYIRYRIPEDRSVEFLSAYTHASVQLAAGPRSVSTTNWRAAKRTSRGLGIKDEVGCLDWFPQVPKRHNRAHPAALCASSVIHRRPAACLVRQRRLRRRVHQPPARLGVTGCYH
jgi:hypothetical protein